MNPLRPKNAPAYSRRWWAGAFVLLAQPIAAPSQTRPDVGPLRGQPFVRMTGDVLGYELVPSFKGTYKGASFFTNQWGMRDKNYDLTRPARTYRIALVGSSFTMGGGVPADQNIESLVENQLNRDGPGAPRRRYEILNFSVGGYGILQNVAVTERKVFAFTPNAVLLVIHSSEALRMTAYLTGLVRAGVEIDYPYIREKLQGAGVLRDMGEPELRRRLSPYAADLVRWSYQRIADKCHEHGSIVVGILFPEPMPRRGPELSRIAGWASEAGIPLLSLDGAYAGHPLDSVKLPGELHLNALGHRLVADRLYQALRINDERGLKLGFLAQPTSASVKLR